MRLVIAEKPELGRNIAHAVCGAPEGVRLPFEGEPYCVVACAGHLLQLEAPDSIDPERWGDPWREETLPILPRPWPKVVAKGKEGLVKTIARYVSRADEVVHAGDPDDEGQMIVDELLEFLGYAGPVRRVLVNDNIDANIRRAFERMDDNSAHVGAGRAANARSIADFCFGANETRLATVRAGRGVLLSVGRVQTPTLGLIVRRDLEIARHKASEYLTLVAECTIDGGERLEFKVEPDKALLDEAGRLSDQALAARLRDRVATLSGEATCAVEEKTTPPPLPFNLTELTAYLSKSAKMSAKRVMDATQGLRDEHRAITYNRSDCSYLPTEGFAVAPSTMARAMANVGKSWRLDFTSMPRCFDDSKIDAHTGIIPQDIAVDLARLTADERAAYVAIVERYAMQFAGDEEFLQSVTTTCGEGFTLTHRAKRQTAPGWRAVADDGKGDKGYQAGWLDAGPHQVKVENVRIEHKKTKPKRPYTEGTLVKDMANCARYLTDDRLREALRRKDEGKPGEHGSIGTTATRARIIETLKERGFVTEEKGYLLATGLGKKFYDSCPPEIRGVDTTAAWWLIQEQVAAGKRDEYAVAESVVRVFESHRASAWKGVSISRADSAKQFGPCPICGKPVVDRGPNWKRYTCSSNDVRKGEDGKFRRVAGCGFELWKSMYGKRLTERQVTDLLTKGKTGLIKGLKGKDGPFEAYLVWEDKAKGTVGRVYPKGRRG